MEDSQIIQMYLSRDENAIFKTNKKYSNLCYSISYGILRSKNDAEEIVNDAYLALWNSIPPYKPQSLAAYISKIVRRLSIDKLRGLVAQKRGGSEASLCLDELGECISETNSIDSQLDSKLLSKAISDFLLTLSEEKRKAFVLRYWYGYSIKELCRLMDFTKPKAVNMLSKVRCDLRAYLEKEDLFYE